MIRRTRAGVILYQFASLAKQPEIVHAVFTRVGGRSARPFDTLNVGQLVGDEPSHVARNRGLVLQTLGLGPQQVVTARQVHGAQVATVDLAHAGTIVPDTDALVTNISGMALLLRFADCLPVLLYDPRQGVIALAHAGWRGCLAGVVPRTLWEMQHVHGSDPGEIIACLGPAIGPCCYEVGSEVVDRVRFSFPNHAGLLLAQHDGSMHLDLPAAVRRQLEQAHVQHIEESATCTCCHTEEFFSHRASSGRTGRFAVLLGLRQPPTPA
jgi:YfiH family protein